MNTQPPRFTLTSFLLVVAIVATAFGWFLDRQRLERKLQQHVVVSQEIVGQRFPGHVLLADSDAEQLQAALNENRGEPLDDQELVILRDIVQLFRMDAQLEGDVQSTSRFYAGMWMQLRNWDSPEEMHQALDDAQSIFETETTEASKLEQYILDARRAFQGR